MRRRVSTPMIVPSQDQELLRLMFTGRSVDVEMICPEPTGALECIWTMAQVRRILPLDEAVILRLCDLLSIVPRRLDESRPDLILFSPGDVRRLVAANRIVESSGIDQSTDDGRRMVVAKIDDAAANAHISMFTDLLDGIWAGPDQVAMRCIKLFVEQRRRLRDERLGRATPRS